MKAPTSLQKDLVYGLTLGMVLLWLLATLLSGLVVRHELDEAFDNALQETAQRILPLAVLDILNREDGTTPQRVAAFNAKQNGFTYIVRDQQGRILLQSSSVDATAVKVAVMETDAPAESGPTSAQLITPSSALSSDAGTAET